MFPHLFALFRKCIFQVSHLPGDNNNNEVMDKLGEQGRRRILCPLYFFSTLNLLLSFLICLQVHIVYFLCAPINQYLLSAFSFSCFLFYASTPFLFYHPILNTFHWRLHHWSTFTLITLHLIIYTKIGTFSQATYILAKPCLSLQIELQL